MQANPSPSYLNLDRLSDYALDEADLLPLLETLASDLEAELLALTHCLRAPSHDATALHRHLHALKGMAGMFAMPEMHANLTRADDACRAGDLSQGVPQTERLLFCLKDWLSEVRACLQRYS